MYRYRGKIRYMLPVLAVSILLAVLPSCRKNEEHKNIPPPVSADLSEHPVYSSYGFNNTGQVINIGTQPLYMPTGLITETMKRDRILGKTLEEMGIEVRFFPFSKGHDVNYFLESGALDAGIGGDMPAITAASTSDVIIPSLIQHGFVAIVAGRRMLIKELEGCAIGYAVGSNAHYSLLNVLNLAGLDMNKVKLVPMDVFEMPDALASGEIDAFSAWEPVPFLTGKEYPDTFIIHRSLSSGYIYFTGELYESNPEAVRQIMAAELRAFYWITSTRDNLLKAGGWAIDESLKLSESLSHLSRDEAAALALNDIMGLTSLPVITERELSGEGRLYKEFIFLRRLGKLPPGAAWDEVHDSFDTRILDRIIEGAGQYRINKFDYNG